MLLWGVTRENQEKVAASISPGDRYKFDVGAGSFKMRDFLYAIKQAGGGASVTAAEFSRGTE